MFVTNVLAIITLLQAVAAAPFELEERQTTCQSVHVFIGRGSDEPYPGRQGDLVTAICSDISSCGYEDITYPATFDDYCDSVATGISNGISQITAYANRCPNAKLVLTGYSQGGHLIGDILGGGGGNFQGCTQRTNSGLSPTTSPGNKIVAATFFGDVRYTARQSYNVGTGASGSGIWPRSGSQLTSLNQWSAKLHSWCLSGDPVCAGGNNFNDHTRYFTVYTNEAAVWVKTKL